MLTKFCFFFHNMLICALVGDGFFKTLFLKQAKWKLFTFSMRFWIFCWNMFWGKVTWFFSGSLQTIKLRLSFWNCAISFDNQMTTREDLKEMLTLFCYAVTHLLLLCLPSFVLCILGTTCKNVKGFLLELVVISFLFIWIYLYENFPGFINQQSAIQYQTS